MRIKTLALLLQLNLVLFLSGCNLIDGVFNYGKTLPVSNLRENDRDLNSQLNLEENLNLIEHISSFSVQSLSFNNFCGDDLTEMQSEFPLVVYPVVINLGMIDSDNSKQILEQVKLLSCSLILKKEKEETQIMLALFTSKERAENFILSSRLPKAKVGNPVRIEHPPDAEVAQLGQINTSLVSWLIYIGAEKEKLFKIIVPTHIPPNFRLASINISSGQYRKYKLNYQGINGECFSMEGLGFPGGGGGDFSRFQQIDIKSDIFGTEKFIYSEGHDNKSFFGPAIVLLIDDNSIPKDSIEGAYVFESHVQSVEGCQMVTVTELVKIFQSMKYLNN